MGKNLSFFFVFLFLLFLKIPALAVTYPQPQGYVNDYAGILTQSFRSRWEEKLQEIASQKAEVTVVTVKSLEGEEIEEYAVRLFEKWRLGKKDVNNGMLLLIAPNERKVRIEVGYGLEPYITDGRAGQIIRTEIVPQFAHGDYEKGVENGLTAIINYLESDKTDTQGSGGGETGEWIPLVFFALFILYIFITYLASFLGRTREIWPGAALGAILGGLGGFVIYTLVGLFIGALSLTGLGLFLDWLLSKNYQERKKKGLPTNFFGSWGGLSGGGFSRGGGFGGFGGGLSGGGGASGKW